MKKSLRYLILFLLFVGSELFVKAFLPFAGLFIDFFLLFLIFVGFQIPSARFLWFWGAVIGFLKDAEGGGLFGGWTCAFAVLGWIVEKSRRFFEQEDPLIQGVWTALLTIIVGFVYGIIVALSDPMAGWSRLFWWTVPLSAGLNGLFAVLFFPRSKKWLIA